MKTHLLFVEYEIAFDSIQRQALFEILKYSRYIIKGNSGHTHTQNKILRKSNSRLLKLDEINKGVCLDCPLLPILFNMYLDDIKTKWQKEDIKGIPLPKYQQLLMLLFISDQVIISNREDNLQKAAYKFSQILKKINK